MTSAIALIALLLSALFAAPARADETAPFVPASDATVLLHIERAGALPAALREARQQLSAQPQDLPTALRFARAAIDLGRAEGDPRDFGYAEAALQPWWNAPRPPSSVILQRAIIRQWRHDFSGAITDLDTLINADADETDQAHLTRASLRMVQGDDLDALRDCVALIGRVDLLTVSTCITAANSLRGHAPAALAALDQTLGRLDAQSGTSASRDAAAAPLSAGTVSILDWSHTVAAEIADRLGNADLARQHFERALRLVQAGGSKDPYLLAAYADFLIDHGEPAKALALVRDEPQNDNLLLRRALAEQALLQLPIQAAPDSSERAALALALQDDLRLLSERFDTARQRGDSLHQREEAMFELLLRHSPDTALQLALENWGKQREPLDARLVLQAAQAAGDRAAGRDVREWIARTGIQDRQLQALAGP